MKYKNNEDYIGKKVPVKGYKAPRYKKVEEDIPTIKIEDSKPGKVSGIKKEILSIEPMEVLYTFNVSSLNKTFNHSLIGSIDEFDDDEFIASFGNELYMDSTGDEKTKTFKTLSQAEKWVYSKFESEINRYKKDFPEKKEKPTPKAIQKDIKVDYRLSDEELNKKYSKELKAIENAYLKHFPNGGVKAYFKSVIGSPSLYVRSYLIKDRKDQTSGLFDNDPLKMNFLGFIKDNGQIELENTQGVLWVNPPKDSFLAMGRVKALKRKQTTTLDKHVINLEKHYKKVAKIFEDNKDNLYKKDIDKKYLKVIL